MRVFFLLSLMGAILLTSCAYFSPGETRSKKTQEIQEPPEPPKADPRLEAGQRLLRQGRYKEAIVEFEAVLEADPSSRSAVVGLRSAQKKLKEEREKIAQNLTQLNESGLQFYHREEYLKAGLAWKEALDLLHSQNDSTIEGKLPIQIEITRRLEQLIRILVDKGVLLYRQGKLQNAVYVWQDVLMVEPEHVEAKDYIRKARVKMETLEKLSFPPGLP